jgi:hypothetical protein
MKTILTLIFFFSLSTQAFIGDKFSSAHSIALDGVIPKGKIITRSTYAGFVESEIREQLMYTIGQFNGLYGGVPDINKLEIEILSQEQLSDGKIEVTYTAKLFIAWPREQHIPSSYMLILPKGGDYSSLQSFYQEYGSDEEENKDCLAWEAHNVSQSIFWYYYRPEKYSCRLNQDVENEIYTHFPIHLRESEQNTYGKFPEYGKIWEDQQLVITTIFGKAEEGAESESDAGISAFRDTVNKLLFTFGSPESINVELRNGRFVDSVKNNQVLMTFSLPQGTLDIALFLIDGIRVAPLNFQEIYNQRTLISDFISYSGHSGLGANIRALAHMGNFQKDQYQIFLINGCDTFAYVDEALRDAHHKVNPDFGPDKFVDIITNAMPSYFHMNRRSNMEIITALVDQKLDFEQILNGFDQRQRAVVTGEQDNKWPLDFYAEE